MAKRRSCFVCQECGHESPRWMGRCPGCGNWNTLVEETISPRSVQQSWSEDAGQVVSITKVDSHGEPRFSTGIGELDRVLGGGLVPGSLVLIGGEPGIGKSTLLLQAAGMTARSGKILYVSGEESPQQVRNRAERLDCVVPGLYLFPETDLPSVLETAARYSPQLVIIDSIQTMVQPEISSAPGSVAQVRQCTTELLRYAKTTGTAVCIVGHVTKGGAIAGPKVLEHAVDAVLYFEGESSSGLRLLRAVKNRFGSTNEIGVFAMQDGGLQEVANPSELFMSERPVQTSGSVVVPCIEGSRSLLLEVQALVARAPFGGVPRRQTAGIDRNRAAIMLAVLEKRASMELSSMDVYLNVAGGVRIQETAADLGVVLAVASSYKDVIIPNKVAAFGEVGLAGEIRAVRAAQTRLQEAAKLGFTTVILPDSNLRKITAPDSISCHGVHCLEEALNILDIKEV